MVKDGKTKPKAHWGTPRRAKEQAKSKKEAMAKAVAKLGQQDTDQL